MRYSLPCFLIIILILISCFKPEVQNGTLHFSSGFIENLEKHIVNQDAQYDTCDTFDLLWKFASFEISTDSIISGNSDTLNWISVYSDTSESRLSEFRFDAELPPGTYKTIRCAMRNRSWWVLELGDTSIMIPNDNRRYLPPDSIYYTYNDINGCWYCDSGVFESIDTAETVENIIINNNSAVDITMNFNLDKIILNSNLTVIDWITREGHEMIEWNIEY
jgi:hypothetical protein